MHCKITPYFLKKCTFFCDFSPKQSHLGPLGIDFICRKAETALNLQPKSLTNKNYENNEKYLLSILACIQYGMCCTDTKSRNTESLG